MTRIRVLLFAQLAEAAGADSIDLDLPAGATAGDALEAAIARHPAMRPLAARVALAVNEQYARPERVLVEGDEVAVIPPVSGG